MYKSTARFFALVVMGLLVLGSANRASAQSTGPAAPLPQPAPGGAPNIFYGGVNPGAAPNSPVVVFIHGLGSNATYFFTGANNMYQEVYNAGYRSAYLSMNADNSNNNALIQQNANTILSLMPQVLQHFGVQQVYMYGHSEGGLEIQVAMLNPTFMSEVKAVFCIATPNQGTELADWAFGPGQKIANIFGFLSPGLLDLKPEHVATLRAQLDPVFAAALIPFYTLSGNTYSLQGDLFYHITGPILANLTNGAKNDGLVATTEVPLPDSYSEDLGSIGEDHTHMGYGTASWPYVYGRIAGLENRFSGWKEIASGGLGDDENTWIWSQTWFQGNLFIGTGRLINCDVSYSASQGSGLPLYPPPGNNCPEDPSQLGTGAEIWKYTPQTKTWVMVYQAPQTIPIGNDLNGNPAFCATAIGFRGMTVYTESDGTQALYVGGVSGNSIYGTLPQFTPNLFPPPIVLRSTDGVNFTPIPEDPGTALGDVVSANSDIQVASIRSLVGANGQMFAAVTNFRGEGFMMASPNPSQGNNAWQRVSPAPAVPNFAVWILAAYNNALYVGTGDRQNDLGYGVYKTTNGPGDPTPYQFTPIIEDGGWQPDEQLRSPTTLSLHVWNDPADGLQHLMVGTDRKIEIARVNPDDSWDLVMGQPRSTPDGWKAPLSGIGYYFDNDFNGHIWQMQDETWNTLPGQTNTNLGLHATTWDWSILFRNSSVTALPTTGDEGFDHFYSPDAIHWYIVSKDGMGDGLNMGGRSGVFSPFGLFWGTARVEGGTQEWQDLSMLDLNSDGQIDQNDANIIIAALGQPDVGVDPRDLNGNGVIDAQDVQFLESQCTFPNCATVPPPGIGYTVPPVPFQGFLTSETQAAAGNNVVLSWPSQPNVARYHVFTYTTTPAIPLILNGAPSQTITVSSTMTVNFPADFMNGTFNAACPTDGSGEDLLWVCTLVDVLTNTDSTPTGALTFVGFPAALQEIAQVAPSSNPTFSEPMRTTLQSLYFIRAEDVNGNLSLASNVVGGPSFNQTTALQ